MPSEFRPATEADLDRITELLKTAFGATPDAPFLDRALLEWKFFAPGPEWNGSRSYVLFENETLLAHGCAWPVQLACNGAIFSALTLIDWASVRASPGAGFQLVRRMASLADILISIGGSEATRHIMPRIGFRVVQEETLYARVLRPWRQFRTRPGALAAREIARLLRNTGYAMAPRASLGSWSVSSAASIDAQSLIHFGSPHGPRSLRSSEFLQYMTRCPGARITLHTLARGNLASGYAVLSQLKHQARLAEMRIPSEDQAEWNSSIAAILEAALEAPTACELIAWASGPPASAALEANGFRPRGRRSVFVSDPRNLIPGHRRWDLSMLDDDSAILNVPEYPYAT